MAVVELSTAGPRRALPCVCAGKQRVSLGSRRGKLTHPVAWSVEVLADMFHRAERGALRAHARAERLVECLMTDGVELRSFQFPWLPPRAPLPILKQRLAKAGSPGVAEGEGHARLRLGAYALAAAWSEPGDKILLEAPTPSACRPDVTLIRQDGTRLLGIECGAVSGNTLADHLNGGGLAAVLVLPFSMLEGGEDALRGWLLARGHFVSGPLPTAAAMLTAYAALIAPDASS